MSDSRIESQLKAILGENVDPPPTPQSRIERLLEKVRGLVSTTVTNLSGHKNDKDNPHQVTKAQVGLGNVDNTSDMDKPISKAVQTALAGIVNDLDDHKNDTDNPHKVNKNQIGLGNVDNTSDANKPISTAAQAALDKKADLDENGKVPAAQLPSYVDDVLEFDTKDEFPISGESGKIYVDTSTNLTYRWSGSGYIEISKSLALGTTVSTAFPGDKGQKAYDDAAQAMQILNNLLDMIHPVGSIYISVNQVNPSILFGGEWEQMKERFLLGAGDVHKNGATGGEAAHALTTSEMPSHTHTFTGTAASHSHSLSGSSGNQSADHTHAQVAHTHTVGNQSANHTHAQVAHTHTVGNQSADHTHAQVAHAHTVNTPTLSGTLQCVCYNSSGATGIVSTGTNMGNKTMSSGSYYGTQTFTINASHTHTVNGGATTTGGQSANHNHTVNGGATTTGSNSADHNHTVNGGATTTGGQSANHTHSLSSGSATNTSITPSGTNSSTGSGDAHNNMPPYITCYMWKRVA